MTQRTRGQNTEWNNIPQARLGEMETAYSNFGNALQDSLDTYTPANILSRQEAQAAATAALCAFVNQFLRFPPVTNTDCVEMSIPNHDTIRTDYTIVTENVDFVIHLSTVREFQIDFWIMGSGHKVKHSCYDGTVIIWGVQNEDPKSPDELEHHAMASRTPFTLHFEEADHGKKAWVACCWQNERGITGTWSVYKDAIIP